MTDRKDPTPAQRPAAAEPSYCALLLQGEAHGPLLYYPAGADLAVVDLGGAVQLPHATPLLTPPHGFAPVQDTPQVTRAGRGFDETGTTATMREGPAPLTRWFNQVEDRACGAWDDATRPWLLQTPIGVGATTQPGDSGGPVLATVGGVEQVIEIEKARAQTIVDIVIVIGDIVGNCGHLCLERRPARQVERESAVDLGQLMYATAGSCTLDSGLNIWYGGIDNAALSGSASLRGSGSFSVPLDSSFGLWVNQEVAGSQLPPGTRVDLLSGRADGTGGSGSATTSASAPCG